MSFRKVLFWTHLVLGLTAGLFILTIAVTGSILAFEPQIVEFAERKVRRVEMKGAGERLSPERIVEAASAEKEGKRAMGLTLKRDGNFSVVVSFGKEGSLFVNPFTGQVLGGASKTHDFMHWVEDVHRFLGSKAKGKPLMNACALIFFLMIPSGLYLWLPKRWDKATLRGITWFIPRVSGKARDFNWHNVIGLWFSPALLVIAATGLIMAYTWANDLLYRAAGTEPPPAKKEEKAVKPTEKTPERVSAGFDLFIRAAAEKRPDWQSLNVRMPQKPDGPVTVAIQHPGVPEFFRSNLTLDFETAQEKKWEPVSSLSRGRVWRVWARYLHTGEALGWAGQLLAFVTALGGALLVYTGVALSWRRFFGKKTSIQ
jgi:uncharacterized iron-regulated membrane protein